jgi:hypothetical protein
MLSIGADRFLTACVSIKCFVMDWVTCDVDNVPECRAIRHSGTKNSEQARMIQQSWASTFVTNTYACSTSTLCCVHQHFGQIWYFLDYKSRLAECRSFKGVWMVIFVIPVIRKDCRLHHSLNLAAIVSKNMLQLFSIAQHQLSSIALMFFYM